MKKLLLAIVMAFTLSAVSFAQTAAEVNATQKKMMAASTPCNGAPEAFKTFIAQFSTDKDLRYYMLQYIRQQGSISPKAHNNWRFVPAEIVEPAIKRDYQRLFGAGSQKKNVE